ncbi:MAG: hypothetical protein QOH89_3265, partial [Pseudonocardiales bacterium]|nr:hypothetical protein [Pseudonocardiales bacterium]
TVTATATLRSGRLVCAGAPTRSSRPVRAKLRIVLRATGAGVRIAAERQVSG